MLTVATFNLCNLGADTSPTRLARLADVIAHTINSPDILAVQEVTASGTFTHEPAPANESYRALIVAIQQAGGARYDFREVPPMAHQDGGLVGAHIRVGLLFNPERVCFPDRGAARSNDHAGLRYTDRAPHLLCNPGRIHPTHPAFAGDDHHHWAPSRKMLATEVTVAGKTIFVIVCHFKSMRAATRREEDYAKKQRHAQAEVVHHFATDLLACDPNAAVILLGDFNDLPGSRTLKLLKGEFFHSLGEDLPRGQYYTRRHGGRPQALDHILVSPALRQGATLHIPHVHSDAVHGHGKPEPASDHDPMVATFDIPPL